MGNAVKTIMIVDDNSVSALYQKGILENEGFKVVYARDSDAALAFMRDTSENVDLILMDIELGPEMDGVDLAAMILELRHLPVVFISSHTEEQYVSRTKKVSSYGYIVKDSVPAVFVATINMAFRLFDAYVELEKKEKALRDSQELFRLFLEHSPVYVFFKDKDIRSLYLSRNYEQMVGRPMSELIGKTMDELFPSALAASMVEDDKRILREGIPIDVEEELDGHYYMTRKFPIILDGVPTYLAGFTVDITERKKAEQELLKVLMEKETLMRELQHRIKNNLGIISSLINLQIGKLDDEKSRHVLQDAQSRIYSMYSIYERLSSSTEYDIVSIESYIVDLIRLLVDTYAVDKGKISLNLKTIDVKLDVKRAVLIGLIVNEVVINIIKYAYPENLSGTINVVLSREGEHVTLVIFDKGIGFPENVDIDRPEKMGLRLVKMLALQIGADLVITHDNGVRIALTFRV